MEFVEVGIFRQSWKKAGCGEEELRQLQIQLVKLPEAGPIISGTGGARKLRFARDGRGKSGDMRVIYVHFPTYTSIALIFVYEKGFQENLTESDKKAVKALIAEIESVLPLKARKGKNNGKR